MTDAQQPNEPVPEQHFAIQRIYVKDLSFEAPGVPDIFQHDWKPDMHLDLHTQVAEVQTNVYEVMLTLTVNVKSETKTAFLVQVQQAGIFTIVGFSPEQMDHTLKAYCPSVLFPFAREVVSDLVTRGSFPQLVLAPVNFDALYAQHLEQQGKQEVIQ
jgi:preprotein translocase subunit SecB